jgi:hypothetical protein
MFKDWVRRGGRSGDMTWAPLVQDHFDALKVLKPESEGRIRDEVGDSHGPRTAEEEGEGEQRVREGEDSGSSGGGGGGSGGGGVVDDARRKFSEKELMGWASDRMEEVAVEEKRVRVQADTMEKKSIKQSAGAASGALAAMRQRSVKIMAAASGESSGHVEGGGGGGGHGGGAAEAVPDRLLLTPAERPADAKWTGTIALNPSLETLNPQP